MRPSVLTLSLYHPAGEDRRRFAVCVGNRGTPDFRIKADSFEQAKILLEDYVYNELDGREEVSVD